jgi:hypothetical protein
LSDGRIARAIAAATRAGTTFALVATDLAHPPTPADLAALLDEPLPPLVRRDRRGGAAAGIDWLARDIAGLKVGLALGAGSARGFAHLGALRALACAGVPIDALTGTSIGAVVAAGWACGHSVEHVAALMSATGPRVLRATIPHSSLFGNRALRTALRRMTGEQRIEDLPLPFAAVAADLATQEPVILGRGPLVLASAAVPASSRRWCATAER